MEEQLISFETAKLVKEKGFYLSTQIGAWYNAFGTLYGRTDLNKDGEHICKSGSFQNSEERANNVTDVYNCVTQSLLQKWLREEHKIFIYCSPKARNDGIVWSSNYHIREDKYFNTFEKALEEGLFEGLKLIP